ncbi:MAG: hypothetical protein MJ147_00835 [Clostridia bacterium]|nr:hypothetical protein [Clostridia bacterium]
MPNEIYENIIENQNNFITARTAEINELKDNTATALASLSALANRVYGYTHTAVVTDSLDAVYSAIIAENNELAELSAVGFTAMLHAGDTITMQGNRVFINGTEAQTDYAFSGENSAGGTEFVNVWYFEKNNSLVLSDEISFNISEIKIFEKSAHIVLNNSYTDFVHKAEASGFTPANPICCRELTENGIAERSLVNATGNLVAYHSDMTTMSRNFSGLAKNTNLKLVDLPELLTIGEMTDNSDVVSTFAGCSNPNLIFNFPKLKNISGGFIFGSDNAINERAIFRNVRRVELPESVVAIKNVLCYNNEIIVLNCRNAESISDNWCTKAPTGALVMCADWGASINLATAAANWSKADFIDLFQNKLRDMGEDVREIKIPSAIFDSLTDEEFELVENKGWTIGC